MLSTQPNSSVEVAQTEESLSQTLPYSSASSFATTSSYSTHVGDTPHTICTMSNSTEAPWTELVNTLSTKDGAIRYWAGKFPWTEEDDDFLEANISRPLSSLSAHFRRPCEAIAVRIFTIRNHESQALPAFSEHRAHDENIVNASCSRGSKKRATDVVEQGTYASDSTYKVSRDFY